jgi:hypothetical protein
MDIGYYASAARTTLNLGVFLCAFVHLYTSTSHVLHPPYQELLTSYLRIFKRVLLTVLMFNPNDIGVLGRRGS